MIRKVFRCGVGVSSAFFTVGYPGRFMSQRTQALARLGYGGIASCRAGPRPALLAFNAARSARELVVFAYPLTTKVSRGLAAVKTVRSLLTVSETVE